MRINREIRAPKVRVIGPEGDQIGVMTVPQALQAAEEAGLDLVEVSPNAEPPVCKIVDYGKYRYQQTKKEKENKKSQHQVKVKEIKLKPNIDTHDLETKLRHARDFILKGDKVRLTCTFRGRELMYTDKGQEVINYLCDQLADIATPESPAKLLGKILSTVLAPGARKK